MSAEIIPSSVSKGPLVAADFVIIGGGIAGASAASWLAPHGKVILLERESQPGYHSTGRSAALFMESYGTAQVRALTMASRAFFENPPPGFNEYPLLSPRGALFVADSSQGARLEQHWDVLCSVTTKAQRLTPSQALALMPVLKRENLLGAVLEPDAADMDVHAIHQGYLRRAKSAGCRLVCNADVRAIEKVAGDWHIHAGATTYAAPIVLNAAGAWVDQIAELAGVEPLGIEPRRRSALIFAPPPDIDISHWPMTIGANEDWYVKPDAGMLLGSPANADPVVPQDVQPEELDIAMAIARLEEATTLTIRRPTRTWAGLRSFVSDGDLVAGFDDKAEGFFWVAAQGGYGIQTSPAMGEACAALARGKPIPAHAASFGVTTQMLCPDRLRAPRLAVAPTSDRIEHADF